jgi:hypothetical protein
LGADALQQAGEGGEALAPFEQADSGHDEAVFNFQQQNPPILQRVAGRASGGEGVGCLRLEVLQSAGFAMALSRAVNGY